MAGIAAMLLVLLPAYGRIEPRWYFNPERAFRVAQERNVPVMLDLYDDRARFGRWFDAFVYADPRVREIFGKVVPMRLSVNGDGRQFVEKYRFRSTPFVLFFHPNGKAYWRITGRMGPAAFKRQVTEAIRMLGSVDQAQQAAANRRGTADQLSSAAIYASVNGNDDLANDLLKRAERLDRRCSGLGEAFACVGESYRMAGQFDRSIGFYEKAAAANDAVVAARALMGIAIAHWRSERPELASKALARIDRIGGESHEFVLLADRMRARLSQRPIPFAMSSAKWAMTVARLRKPSSHGD